MILDLAPQDSPILRIPATPVLHFDDKLHEFVDNLVETLIYHNGWGLAAPQVASSQRIFAISVTEEEEMDPLEFLMLFTNPRILSVSKRMTVVEEGCLSLPGLLVPVLRPYQIEVEYQTIHGEVCTKKLKKMEARCFLHELDHLNGILITDYAKNKENYAPNHR